MLEESAQRRIAWKRPMMRESGGFRIQNQSAWPGSKDETATAWEPRSIAHTETNSGGYSVLVGTLQTLLAKL